MVVWRLHSFESHVGYLLQCLAGSLREYFFVFVNFASVPNFQVMNKKRVGYILSTASCLDIFWLCALDRYTVSKNLLYIRHRPDIRSSDEWPTMIWCLVICGNDASKAVMLSCELVERFDISGDPLVRKVWVFLLSQIQDLQVVGLS